MRRLKAALPLITAFVWGMGFVAQVVGASSISPFSYNAARNLLGAVALLPIAVFFDQRSESAKRSVLPAIICGVVLFVAQSAQQIGLELTRSPAKGGFLTSLYAVMVPVLEIFVLKRKVKRVFWVSAALSFLGLFMIFAGSADSLQDFSISRGDWFLIANSLLYAIHILLIDRFVPKVRPILFSLIQFAVVGMISSVVVPFFETASVQAFCDAACSILYGGLMSIAIGYTLQVLSQKNPNVILTSIMFSTESVFAALGGFIILGERLSALSAFGCALVFASIVLAQVVSKR